MIAIQPGAALALPLFGPEVPNCYTIPGVDQMTVPLTIALLDANVITDAMLRTPRNALLVDVFGETEKQLSQSALSHWWTRLIRANSCKFFRWSLHVQQLDDTGHGCSRETTAWFCLVRMDGEMPRFALAAGVEKLERLLEGFGQTVLAVLRDATNLLPDSFTPWFAQRWAESAYWQDSADDIELLEMRREMSGFDTVQELLEAEHVITRAVFYREMPEWVCEPERTRTRDEIGAAASTDLARRVIQVCDELHALVSKPGFVLTPLDKGAWRCGHEGIDGSMVLLWKQYDVVGQAIDDYLEDLGNCGEYCEFIDANPVPMTAEGIRDFQIRTEQALQVAVLTEKLILLLGEKF